MILVEKLYSSIGSLMKLNINFANPCLVYAFVWLLVLGLVSLKSAINILPLNLETATLVLSNIATFAIIYYFFKQRIISVETSKQILSNISITKLRIFVRFLLGIWFVGTIFEIIISKGVPLLWIFTNNNLNYTNFGIPTFHGIMNALYLFSITSLFLEYVANKQKKMLYLIGCLLLWPVIMIGRGILLGALLQMLAIYLLCNKQNIRQILKIIIAAILAISIFGVIGDFRASKIDISRSNTSTAYTVDAANNNSKHEFYLFPGVFDRYIEREDRFYFHLLPSGFTWFYFYMTSPINNIIANIKNLQPSYVPYYSIFLTIPTVFRDLVFPKKDPTLIKMKPVDSEFNVSTFYVGFLADFGLIGAIISVAILQVFCTIFYLLARQKKIWAMLAYAVIFECIVFSVFFNLFFLPVYLMQIMLAFIFKWYIDRSKLEKI